MTLDHISDNQDARLSRYYFLRTIFNTRDRTVSSLGCDAAGFANASWKTDSLPVQRVTMSTTLFSNHRTIIPSLCHTPVVHTANGPHLSSALPESRIRFAITTSVNIRSPTITNSSFLIGTWRVEKYVRMDLMHEYAGLGELCRRTGTER